MEALVAYGVPERDACLVLDVDLPGIGGIAFKQALAAAGHDLPAVFIAALAPKDVGAQFTALAPVAVLYKPFDQDDLVDTRSSARVCRAPTRTTPTRPREDPQCDAG